MKFVIFFTLLFFCIFLSACETATGYHPLNDDGGYQDMQLSATKYKVLYRGNSNTSKEYLTNLMLYHCANLTLKNGYKFFAVLEKDGSTDSREVTETSGSQQNYVVVNNNSNNPWASNQPIANPFDSAPKEKSRYTVNKHTLVYTISLSNSESAHSYNAALIKSSIETDKETD